VATIPLVLPQASFRVDLLQVEVYRDRAAMGLAAAQRVAHDLRALLSVQKRVSVVFAAAPSQEEFLAALVKQSDVEWSRVVGFHMDEYVGLPAEAPQSFRRFLRERLFERLPFGAVHYLNGNAADLQQEIDRYSALLRACPPDIICAGVGENGHLAFNDPHAADLHDPALVKVVELTLRSRQQQVRDGCFASLKEVPEHALTLTIPALVAAARITCVVPAGNKAEAVRRMLTGAVSMDCPATILRQHPHAVLCLEPASAALWLGSDSEAKE